MSTLQKTGVKRGDFVHIGEQSEKKLRRLMNRMPGWVALIPLVGIGLFAACDVERRRSDAELGLTAQQISGRKLYDNYCDRCHRPYSSKGKKGPGLQSLFKHPYLPKTGLPANDERVIDIVRNGRPDMPGYAQVLSAQDVQDLLAYLHTL